MEELRKRAYEILANGGWLASVSEDERTVTVCTNGFDCTSMNNHDPEFTTSDINEAVNYLYPEY